MPPKADRLALFLDRLRAAPPAASHDEAFHQLADILNGVEDELTDIPYDPAAWRSDGRLYPPQLDSRRAVPGHPDVVRYRSVGHNTYIGPNGALSIRALDDAAVLDKAGADGRTTGL